MCDIDIYRFDIHLMLHKSFANARRLGITDKAAIIQKIYEDLFIEYSDNCPDECIHGKVGKFVAEIYAQKDTQVP